MNQKKTNWSLSPGGDIFQKHPQNRFSKKCFFIAPVRVDPKFEDILLFNLENIDRLIHKFCCSHFVLNSSGPYFGSNWWYEPLSGYDENSEYVVDPKFEDIILFNLENIDHLIHKFDLAHFVLNSSGLYFGSNWWYEPLSGYDEISEYVVDPKFKDTLLFTLEYVVGRLWF